jgi:hypothetical protein
LRTRSSALTEDIVAYLTSSFPGENATPQELRILRAKVADRLDAGNGVIKVSKETGAFVAWTPLRSAPGRSSWRLAHFLVV